MTAALACCEHSVHIALLSPDPTHATILRQSAATHDVAFAPVTLAGLATLPEETLAVFVDVAAGTAPLHRAVEAGQRAIAIGPAGDSDAILAALRAGAADFLPSPLESGAIGAALERARGARARGLGNAQTRPRVAVRFRAADGRRVEREVPATGSLSVGRDPSNDIVFDSQVVSRHHAHFEYAGDGCVLVDNDSRHGAWIEDERVVGRRDLRDGDVVRFGRTGAPEITVAFEQPRADALGRPGDDAGEDAGREFKRLAALLDTFLELNTELVIEDVLSLVIDRSIAFAGAERGMILLLEAARTDRPPDAPALVVDAGTGRELRLAVARDREGDAVATSELDISQKIPQEVVDSGRGVIVEDLLADDRVDAHVNTIEIGVRSAMCVPLRARRSADRARRGSDLLGVLYVDSSSRIRPFSRRLLDALESLASEAAQAIVNARLYQESLEKRRIDEEMRLAREIQESLLPPREFACEWVELCGSSRASHEVGGDVLDYFPGDARIGVLLGDVSGKGVPAAIYSAMLDGHFHALTDARASVGDLGDVAASLNRHLLSRARIERFVTLVYAVLSRDGELRYVNAGHNPPLLVPASGESRHLRAGGTVLGMLDDERWTAAHDQLEPGDVLVLYSDGLTEGRNSRRELYGLVRLERVVREVATRRAVEIHDAVLADWHGFTAPAPPADDVTLMVLVFHPKGR